MLSNAHLLEKRHHIREDAQQCRKQVKRVDTKSICCLGICLIDSLFKAVEPSFKFVPSWGIKQNTSSSEQVAQLVHESLQIRRHNASP